jgi:hypothetical protein
MCENKSRSISIRISTWINADKSRHSEKRHSAFSELSSFTYILSRKVPLMSRHAWNMVNSPATAGPFMSNLQGEDGRQKDEIKKGEGQECEDYG